MAARSNEVMYFLEMPVESQLRNLYAQTGFYEKLQHRFQRQSKDGIYEDVYDGSLYKSYDGPLSKPENISFTLTLMELQSLRAVKCRYGHYSW